MFLVAEEDAVVRVTVRAIKSRFIYFIFKDHSFIQAVKGNINHYFILSLKQACDTHYSDW